MKIPCGFLLLFLISSQTSLAQKVQWRGPDRSGIFPETELLDEWPSAGPELILKVDSLGTGYSSPVLSEGIIYITGKKGEDDYLNAIDPEGNVLYSVKFGKSWERSYPDARSTPTIEKNRIYVISGSGEVACLNKPDGRIIWRVFAHKKYRGEIHRWGVAESPLIVDDKVIYTNGGEVSSVIALDKMTGDEAWKTRAVGGARTYVSPVLYENGQVRQIIASTSENVIGINPEDGNISWTYHYLPDDPELVRRAGISTNSAIIKGNEIFISKGYDQYGVMLQVSEDGNSVTEKWRTEVLDTHHGHYVNVGNFIYGSTWINNSKGNWACINWDTGEPLYEHEWITKGPIAYADGKLYCCEERTGNIALVNATPEKFDIISTFKIKHGSGPHWAHPYISDGKLLIRHGEVLMVFNIKS
ncbi:MAG: PQQ-binding-like beta-propeller repeat protein [Cytophagales bacterium]|nr:PQQ-binding-like beta-propeller repeat protein [Cytophagales bacterium]